MTRNARRVTYKIACKKKQKTGNVIYFWNVRHGEIGTNLVCDPNSLLMQSTIHVILTMI